MHLRICTVPVSGTGGVYNKHMYNVATNIDMRLSLYMSPCHSMGTLNQHYATSIVHCVTLTAFTIVTSTCTQLVSGSSMSIGYVDYNVHAAHCSNWASCNAVQC